MSKCRTVLTLAAVLAAVLIFAACGGDATSNDDTTAPPESTAPAVSTTATPTTAAPATTATTQPPASPASTAGPASEDGWKTVATLKSDDASWEELPGLLVSDPFTVKGKARVVLDMPGAGELDGVILGIIKADQLGDPLAIIDAIRDGISFVLIPSAPVKEIDSLDGTYVLLNSVPAETPWTVELQTP